MSKGFTGSFRGVPIAMEFHTDGSVTLSREVVEEIQKDTGIPGWLKLLLKANEPRMLMDSKPIPRMPAGFIGFTDSRGNVQEDNMPEEK